MENRIYNFSAGPQFYLRTLLREAKEDFISYKGTGMSVMEMSHRSKTYDDIIVRRRKRYSNFAEHK